MHIHEINPKEELSRKSTEFMRICGMSGVGFIIGEPVAQILKSGRKLALLKWEIKLNLLILQHPNKIDRWKMEISCADVQ